MDAPANNIAGITHPDESYYTYIAVHEHVTTKNPDFESAFKTPINATLHVHSYLPTKIGFELFGNTYIGLRVPTAFLSIVSIILICITATFSYKSHSLFNVFIGLCILLLADPYFFIVSRFQSPQIYVVFWHSLVLILFYMYNKTEKKVYLLFAACFLFITIILVYPYSVFAFVGFLIFLIYKSLKEKTYIYFIIALGSIIISFIVLTFVFGMFNYTIKDYFVYLSKFNALRDETKPLVKIGFKYLLISPMQIFNTLLLRYNPIYFFTLNVFTLYVITKWKNTSNIEKITFFIILAAFFQTYFIVSYPFKKWALLFPFFALTIIPVLKYIQNSYELARWHKIAIFIVSFVSVILCFKNTAVNNNHEYWKAFDYGFEYVNPNLYMRLASPVLSVILFLYITYSFIKPVNLKVQFIFIGTIIGSNLIFIWILVFKNGQFEYKNLLTKNADFLNNKIIVGDLPAAYTYYNSALELVNPYAEEIGVDMRLALNAGNLDVNKLVYIKCYKPSDLMANEITSYKIKFKLIKEIEGNLYSFGIYIPVKTQVPDSKQNKP